VDQLRGKGKGKTKKKIQRWIWDCRVRSSDQRKKRVAERLEQDLHPDRPSYQVGHPHEGVNESVGGNRTNSPIQDDRPRKATSSKRGRGELEEAVHQIRRF